MADSFDRYADNKTKGKGPSCPNCGHNENVVLHRMKHRPRLVGLGLPLPYKRDASSWACTVHSDKWID